MDRIKKGNAIVAAAVTLCIAAGLGCTADTTGLATLTVAELAEKIAETPATVVCDANGDGLRKSYGIIPGARLLTSHSSYDVSRELPADKDNPLVFYCSSAMCSAAPTAARRATEAGYTDVYVLPAGIKGWVEAGKPVAKSSG